MIGECIFGDCSTFCFYLFGSLRFLKSGLSPPHKLDFCGRQRPQLLDHTVQTKKYFSSP